MSLTDLLSNAGIAFSVLFPLINPIGGIPSFYSLTASDSEEFRKLQAKKSSLNVVLILIVFLFVGRLLLALFGISLGVLKIAGGLIVANTAWQMVTSKEYEESDNASARDKVDISFMPMAMPILSGPGSIGAVIGLSVDSSSIQAYIGLIIGILLIGAVTYVCLLLSSRLLKYLGKSGINALTKMMGFFILAIAVQLVYTGLLALTGKG